MQYGLEMAVADLNAAGGLLGRPVELVAYDIEELLPETVAASTDYLLDKDKVDVVVEGYGGYGPDFEAYGANSDVPFIHGSGSMRAAEMVARPTRPSTATCSRCSPIEADYGKRAWEGMVQFEDKYTYPNKKIAILHGDLEWDLNYTAAVAAEAKKAGWEVVMNETFPYGTTDWGSILTQIRSEQPAAIVCSVLSVADISSFVKQFMENPTPSLLDISYMVVFKETQEAVGNDLTGVMGYVTSYVTPSAEHDAWKAQLQGDVRHGRAADHPAVDLRLGDDLGGSGEGCRRPDQVRGDRDLHPANPYTGLLGIYDFNNPEQTVKTGPDFQIAYAQYQGDGKLAFFGTDAVHASRRTSSRRGRRSSLTA